MTIAEHLPEAYRYWDVSIAGRSTWCAFGAGRGDLGGRYEITLMHAGIPESSIALIRPWRLYYIAFAIWNAVSSWVSLPSLKASRESSIENFGTMPLFSIIRACQVK